jgi:hypothetical protein
VLLPVTLRSPTNAAPTVVVDGGGVRVEVHDVPATPTAWLAGLMRALYEAE